MPCRLTLLAASLIAFVIAEPAAYASDPAADALFQSGKTLMAEGKTSEACEKFEASFKLEPLLGALLNLASCLEQDGQLAAAWSRWGDAVAQAERQGDDRKSFAEEHRAALEPRIAKLVVALSGEPGDLEVFRDGIAVSKASFNVAIPVDAGAHVIEVARSDDVLHRETVTLKEGEKVDLKLNAVEIAQRTPMGRRAGAASSSRKTALPSESGASPQLVAGLVVGSIGVTAGITGFVFGGLALGKKGEADDPSNCTGDRACAPAGLALIDEAETFAHVSTGLLAGGGALTALGLILVLTTPATGEAEQLEERSDLGPTIRVGLGTVHGDLGVELRGSF